MRLSCERSFSMKSESFAADKFDDDAALMVVIADVTFRLCISVRLLYAKKQPKSAETPSRSRSQSWRVFEAISDTQSGIS